MYTFYFLNTDVGDQKLSSFKQFCQSLLDKLYKQWAPPTHNLTQVKAGVAIVLILFFTRYYFNIISYTK